MEVENETWRGETALLARGGAGTSFCSRLLQLCRQELCDCNEKKGARPKRKQRHGQLASAHLPRPETKTPSSHGSSAINKYVHLLAYNPSLCNTLTYLQTLWCLLSIVIFNRVVRCGECGCPRIIINFLQMSCPFIVPKSILKRTKVRFAC